MKTFNVHFSHGPGPLASSWYVRRGFTAVVSPSTLPDSVQINFSFCSRKDEFHKKKGVVKALEHSPVHVHIKQLPTFLEELEIATYKDPSYIDRKGKYNYVWKAFL